MLTGVRESLGPHSGVPYLHHPVREPGEHRISKGSRRGLEDPDHVFADAGHQRLTQLVLEDELPGLLIPPRRLTAYVAELRVGVGRLPDEVFRTEGLRVAGVREEHHGGSDADQGPGTNEDIVHWAPPASSRRISAARRRRSASSAAIWAGVFAGTAGTTGVVVAVVARGATLVPCVEAVREVAWLVLVRARSRASSASSSAMRAAAASSDRTCESRMYAIVCDVTHSGHRGA